MDRPDLDTIHREVVQARVKAPDDPMLKSFNQVLRYARFLELDRDQYREAFDTCIRAATSSIAKPVIHRAP